MYACCVAWWTIVDPLVDAVRKEDYYPFYCGVAWYRLVSALVVQKVVWLPVQVFSCIVVYKRTPTT